MKKMDTRRWYVVADGARARIVARDGDKIVAPMGEQFIGANLKSREINSDRPGRTKDRVGTGHHAMDPPTDPHRKLKADFARDLAAILEHELALHHYDELMLVAVPQTLGDLRSALSETVRKKVVAEVNKDLTQVPDHELGARLAALESAGK